MRRVGHIDTDPDWTCDRCKKLAKSKSTAEYRGSFYKPYDDRNDFDKYMALQEARKNNRPNKNLFTPPKENPKEFDSGKLFWVMKFGLVSNTNEFYLLYVQLIDEWKEGSWVYEIVHPPIRRGRNDLNNDMPEEFREPPAPGKQKNWVSPASSHFLSILLFVSK